MVVSKVKITGETFKVLQEGYIFCYKSHTDRKENGVGLFIKKNSAGNVEEFFSVSERVARFTIK